MKEALVLLAALALVGCEVRYQYASEPNPPKEAAPLMEKKKRGIMERTACVKGIVYFVVPHDNVFHDNYVTSPVIDPETLQPTRCK